MAGPGERRIRRARKARHSNQKGSVTCASYSKVECRRGVGCIVTSSKPLVTTRLAQKNCRSKGKYWRRNGGGRPWWYGPTDLLGRGIS